MAIDSAEKRKSISGIQHFMMLGVTPSATQDQEWRQESGWGYPGILADPPVPITDINQELIQDFYTSLNRMMNH